MDVSYVSLAGLTKGAAREALLTLHWVLLERPWSRIESDVDPIVLEALALRVAPFLQCRLPRRRHSLTHHSGPRTRARCRPRM